MFTRISSAVCLGFFLGGCELTNGLASQTGQTVPQMPTTALLKGGVVAKGPDGYCFDKSSQRRNLFGRAVVFASCARLSGSDAPDFTDGRLLTATTVGTALTDFEAFAIFLESDAGRTVLSSKGVPSDIKVHRIRTTAAGVYVDHTDAARPDHIGPRAWRGFVNVGASLTALGVYAGKGAPVGGPDGEALIRAFAAETIKQTPSKP